MREKGVLVQALVGFVLAASTAHPAVAEGLLALPLPDWMQGTAAAVGAAFIFPAVAVGIAFLAWRLLQRVGWFGLITVMAVAALVVSAALELGFFAGVAERRSDV
ncbi:MAG: hypothetical protein AB7K67_11920 [Hyphomicrobiaceae bacterium]